MSKTAWIFGDSFQDSSFPKGQTESWVDIVFSEKGYEVKNYARAGISTEAIVTMCRDCIDEIQSDDFVLVCLSSGPRFMSPPGFGAIRHREYENFTRYIDTNLNHPDIWSNFTDNGKDTRVLDYADKYSSPLGDKLKHSTWTNNISLILRDKGVDFNIVHGHFEPIKVESEYVTNYMEDYDLRIFSPEVTKYYDLTDAIKFPTGHCLINDFYHIQTQYILDTHGDTAMNKLKKFHSMLSRNKTKVIKRGRYREGVKKYLLDNITAHFGEECSMFYDSWHLNPTGQRIYASYAKDYNWNIK